MLTIFKRLFKDRLISLILYCLVGILLIWLYVAFFPIIEQQSENILAFKDSIPKIILKAFGVDDFNIISLDGFISFKHYVLTLPVFLILITASIAGTGLSGETERGTIEVPLACPISRVQLYGGIYLTGMVTLLIYTAFAVLTVFPICKLHAQEYWASYHLLITVLSLLFGWAVFSLAMMLSAIFSEIRKTYMVLGGILFAMYLLNFIASTIQSVSWLRYFSFFHYYDPMFPLLNGNLPTSSIFVFSVTAFACSIIGVFWFNGRDVSV